MQGDNYVKFPKLFQKGFLIIYAFGYQNQVISRPFHSTSPLGGTGTTSFAGAAASARPASATGPIMPLITLVNTTIQQRINSFMISHAIT